MQNQIATHRRKIEIHLLTPLTREQANTFVDELKKNKGLDNMILQPFSERSINGEMGYREFFNGVVSGSAEKLGEEVVSLGVSALKKLLVYLYSTYNELVTANVPRKLVEARLTVEDNGRKEVFYFNSDGVQHKFSNREYRLDPANTHVLLIGTSAQDHPNVFLPIEQVKNNIDALREVLTDTNYFGLPVSNVHLMENWNTRAIKDKLQMVSQLDDMTTLFIYFAGHGRGSNSSVYSLINKETSVFRGDLKDQLPLSFIHDVQANSKAQQTILIIDACGSDMATRNQQEIDFSNEDVTGHFTLASTSAGEMSHYDSNATFTYFTHFLIEALTQGVANGNELLSLSDIYRYVKTKLVEANLPEPTHSSSLNIPPDNFFTGKNRLFSFEFLLKAPQRLAEAGNFKEARHQFQLLLKKSQNNELVRSTYLEYEQKANVRDLVGEADLLFFIEKDYIKARDKYREAYELSLNELLRYKIRDCTVALEQQERERADISTDNTKKASRRPAFYLTLSTIMLVVALFAFDRFTRPVSKSEQRITKPRSPALKPIMHDTPVRINVVKPAPIEKIKKPIRQPEGRDDNDSYIPDSARSMINNNVAATFKAYFRNRDFSNAAKLIDAVHEITDREIMDDIGQMYYKGLGVNPSYQKAYQWFMRSAKHGSPAAQNALGIMYERGDLLKKNNYIAAVNWFRKAANSGFAEAQYNLGRMYENNLGVPAKDHVQKAIFWYREAAKQNNVDAARELEKFQLRSSN